MRRRHPFVFYMLTLGIVAAVAFIGISGYFAWRFTTPVRRPFATQPEEFLRAYETVRFPARDGVKLDGWYVPRPGSTKAVVLLHGYGGTRTAMLARARLFHEHGYGVLLYDARAHGTSDGSLGSFGYHETRDLLGALDWLRGRGFSEFGCLGASQGGATIALAGAELRDVKWAVLEGVYPTLPNAVDRRFRRMFHLPGWVAGMLMVPLAEWRLGVSAKKVSPRDAVASLPCPVFVMTGDLDVHTKPEDARQVFDHAREPKQWWLVPGAAHVDLYGFMKDEYERRLLEFVASAK
jgi:dipeptidyl aminopeptidase/acylaminoacyl peptidase